MFIPSLTTTLRDRAGRNRDRIRPALEPLELRVLLSQHTFLQSLQDGVGGVDGLNQAYSIDMSPDGAHVYVAGYADKSVAVFARNTTTGLLTFQQVLKDGVGGVDGLNNASTVRVSPDGRSVYVTGQGDNAVAAFSRNTTTGMLTFQQVLKDGVGGVDGLYIAYGLAVSPDGANVYVTGGYDNAVAMFSRDSATSMLTYMGLLRNGSGGVYGLDGPFGLAVSPDGLNVYTTSGNDDSLGIFTRNPATGSLSFYARVLNGWAGVANLDRPTSVTVSPDGANVYVSGNNSSSVVVFSRNADSSGQLTYRQSLVDGQNGVLGLYSNSGVALSPDGGRVYTCGYAGDAMGIFTRDSANNGQLTFLEALQNNVDGAAGLNGVRSAVVSPDGRHIYAASLDGSTLAVFAAPNHAPVLDTTGDMTLGSVPVGDPSSPGTLVSDLLASGGDGRITDLDPGALTGIAIVSADTANGAWQYTLDGGATWNDMGSPSLAAARLLPSDSLARVRFAPNPGYCGVMDEAIVFRVWDQTSGMAGDTADATTGGGATAFSDATESASVQVGLSVQIGTGQAPSVIYTDADGTLVTLTLKGGTAEVLFSGAGLTAATPPGKAAVVSGTDVQVFRIVATNTTATSTFTAITKGGDGLATMQELHIQGPIRSIAAKTVDFQGELTVDGPITSLFLHDVDAASISLNDTDAVVDPKLALTLMLGQVTNTDIETHGIPIKSANVARWDGGMLEAPWVGALNVTGDKKRALPGNFTADLFLAGNPDPNKPTLNTAKIAGDLDGAEWIIPGPVGSLTVAGSISWCGIGGLASLKSLKAGDFADTEIQVTGPVGSFAVANWDDSDLEATAVKSLMATSFNRGRLQLLGGPPAGQAALGSAKVGAITDSPWDPDERGWIIEGDVASITVSDATDWFLNITGAAKTVKMALATRVDIDVDGPLGAVQATEWRGGSLQAAAVKSFKTKGDKKLGVRGDAQELDVSLDAENLPAGSIVLGSMSLAGAAIDVNLNALGHAGSVTVLALIDSHFGLGCPAANGLAADFDNGQGDANEFTLKTLTLKGLAGQNAGDPLRFFENSTVAAWNIARFKFGTRPEAASGRVQYHQGAISNPPEPGGLGNQLEISVV